MSRLTYLYTPHQPLGLAQPLGLQPESIHKNTVVYLSSPFGEYRIRKLHPLMADENIKALSEQLYSALKTNINTHTTGLPPSEC